MAEDPAEPEYQRVILLNRLVSRSRSRAPQEHKPPILSAFELLQSIEARWKASVAIEFLGLKDREDVDDQARLLNGRGHDYVALRDYSMETRGTVTYAKLLIEFVDENLRSFPVVDTATFKGRELSGKEAERGATAGHVVIRLPGKDAYDDGNYRCAVESVHHLNRTDIERFLCRLLRRSYREETFGVTIVPKGKGKKPFSKEYLFWPRLELFADASRKISFADDSGKYLSHMVFTKRGEKQSTGGSTAVSHEDFTADVEYRVTAKQGPQNPSELFQWVSGVRNFFETSGFESKLYYRGIGGATLSGDVHKAIAGASDLMMCPREVIVLKGISRQWQEILNQPMTDKMIELLDKNELWERSG